jgi:DNA-binding FrmR family transcriptional regulator
VLSHVVREKKRLLARVRRIRGQVEAVERALEAELGCSDVLQLVASVRGAVNGLSAELLEDHIRSHILGSQGASEREDSGEELIELVRTYMK